MMKLMTPKATAPASTARRSIDSRSSALIAGCCSPLSAAEAAECVARSLSKTSAPSAYRRPMTMNEPAYSCSSQPRTAMAACGPMSAAPSPPSSTYEIAWLARSRGTLSAATNRYCAVNAVEVPKSNDPRQKSGKLLRMIAYAHRSDAAMPTPAPAMSPVRRPTSRIKNEAGTVDNATPTTAIETGAVAQEGSGASTPLRSPPNSTTAVRPEPVSTCARTSTATFGISVAAQA